MPSPRRECVLTGFHSRNWLASAHGAMSQSLAIATAYDTLGEEGLQHALVQTGAKAIFCDPHLLPTLVKPLGAATELKTVIYNSDGDVQQEHIDKLKSTHDRLIIMSFEELRALGESNMVDPVPPNREDLCCIMYTSGSTGPPKGVPIKHKAVVAASKLNKATINQFTDRGYSRRCQYNLRPLHRPRRRSPHLFTSRPYPGIRF